MSQEIIPYNKQNINNSDIKIINEVLKSKFLTQGPKNNLFCDKIKKFTKAKYALVLNSATSALHVACLSLNLKKNDYLWTSSNTFISSATSGIHCGAKIDLLDIDLNTGNLSTFDLEKKLKIAKKKRKLPKILVVVHFAGIPCDMKKIKYLSTKYNFKVIEDASHALGARYYKSNIGDCKYSDICIFSFHPIKSITTIEGGAITTNSENIYNSSKLLLNHGIVKNIDKEKKWLYDQRVLGFNFRMSDVSCALGISQIKRIKKFIKKRRDIAKFYNKKLENLPLKTQKIDRNILSSYHLYVVSFLDDNRDNFFKFMLKHKIQLQYHYIPVYRHSFFKKNFKFKKKNFINMENYYKHSISLPIYFDLKKKELNRIVKLIKIFFKTI
jgi:UDP-4-amino-4,6-dideoxy-N-acetyl-beta-L-altrosamine transaminase